MYTPGAGDLHPAGAGHHVQHCIGDVLWPQLDHVGSLLFERRTRWCGEMGEDLGIDGSGTHHANADPLTQYLLTNALTEGVDTEFRQRIDRGVRSGHPAARGARGTNATR